MRKDMVIVGFGGQGIQSLGKNLARALDSQGFLVSLKSNYGPEARGGQSFTEVVIKESPDDWPEALSVNVLVAMSQQGYDAWIRKTAPDSQAFFDVDFVRPVLSVCTRQYPVPATKIANELGSQISANMVMLGAVIATTGLVSLEALTEVVEKEMGKAADVSLKAAERGYGLGNLLALELTSMAELDYGGGEQSVSNQGRCGIIKSIGRHSGQNSQATG